MYFLNVSQKAMLSISDNKFHYSLSTDFTNQSRKQTSSFVGGFASDAKKQRNVIWLVGIVVKNNGSRFETLLKACSQNSNDTCSNIAS